MTTIPIELRARAVHPLAVDVPRAAAREEAYRWLYILRQRRRWAKVGVLGSDLQTQVHASLSELGLTPGALAPFASADVLEISLPFEDEGRDWEARIVPWEFLLREALRASHPRRLLVVRHLRDGARAPSSRKGGKRPLLRMVESSPEPIDSVFAFDFERRLVASSLGVDQDRADGLTLFDPRFDPRHESHGSQGEALPEAADQLAAWLRRERPRVVHVTGVDTREGADFVARSDLKTAAALLPEPWEQTRPGDGMLLSTPDGLGHYGYERLGAAVGAVEPELAAFNFYRTGLRIAAQTVKHGAHAAIGFLDTFDDALAEVFLSAYYTRWAEHHDPHRAFVDAWKILDAHPQRRTLKGTGIVLWTRRSAFHERSQLYETSTRARAPSPKRKKAPPVPLRDLLAPPEISPLHALNYSLMQNERGVFQRFRLALKPGHELPGVNVHVELHAGSERAEYRTSVDLSPIPVELASRIHLPLTAPLARLADERIVSSIYVRISHRDEVLHTDSYRVSLLPIDEWRDDHRDRQWLPCFVLPRDPVVPQLLGRAQRYLRTLADDSSAAFDGYQRDDPEHVDIQAAAIWNTLVHEFPIDYANPPPTYTASSQRVRTPSEIIRTRLGTCIDLSLLFAACLENVDIYPVLILMRGHACVGYWRRPMEWQEYHRRPSTPKTVETGRSVIGDDRAPPWVGGRDAYNEVRDHVRKGALVPLEGTWIPLRRGFEAAVTAGLSNVESQVDFDALIDVVAAREHDVTPLPFTWRGHDGQHG